MSLDIEWLEPPLNPEARVKAELKSNPGRWARVKKHMASATSRSAWRKEGFDTEAHPNDADPKRYDIYARWPAAPAPAQDQPAPNGATPVLPKDATVRPLVVAPAGTQPKPPTGGAYKYRGNDTTARP